MAIEVGIGVVNERTVGVEFDEFPQRAHDRILARMHSITDDLEGRVRGDTPSRTGQLQSEIRSKVYDDGDKIAGRVFVQATGGGQSRRGSSEYGKAAALEYGAHGAALVQAHQRQLSHLFGRAIEPITVLVGSYSRHMNIAEVRYLRGPLEGIAGEAVEQIQAAVDAAVNAT